MKQPRIILKLFLLILAITLALTIHADEPKESERKDKPELSKTKVGKDGAEMVLIPAGESQMGSNPGVGTELGIGIAQANHSPTSANKRLQAGTL